VCLAAGAAGVVLLPRDGTRVFGALAIGRLKMKVHKACVASLFEQHDAVLDVEAVYAVVRAS
jgi:hypothetical protein